MKICEFEDQAGKHQLVFEKTKYVQDNSLAIVAYIAETKECYCCCTVNLGWVVSDSMAYLDTNNLPDICNWLVGMGYAEVVAFNNSGYCTYPLVLFSDEFLNDICIQKEE